MPAPLRPGTVRGRLDATLGNRIVPPRPSQCTVFQVAASGTPLSPRFAGIEAPSTRPPFSLLRRKELNIELLAPSCACIDSNRADVGGALVRICRWHSECHAGRCLCRRQYEWYEDDRDA